MLTQNSDAIEENFARGANRRTQSSEIYKLQQRLTTQNNE
uniref:Uncharacterized protein n=1 Tax=Rhizophora mucronata TaxID=61149 RepID=A0A2P2N7K9_RHIMU